MALVQDEYWLKLAGRKEAGRNERAEKLWRVGKSEEVGFNPLDAKLFFAKLL